MNIKTERCTITELQSSDFQEAVNLFTNENVRMYLGGTISKAMAIDKLYSWTYSKDDLYFSVRISENGDFAGIISITEYYDNRFKELSYQILPEFWGRGITTESISAILEFLKNNTEIKELIAETQSRNLSSCRLLEKLGFELIKTVIRFGADQNIYKLTL